MNSHSSKTVAIGSIPASEVRRLIAAGVGRGTVRRAGEALTVAKNGMPATNFGSIRTQWMDVDPAKARAWLDNNFRNRHIDESTVAAYARDILNGTWVATHQGIAFNDRDELIDGQHRLHAIIRANRTVRMMVTFGLPSLIPGHEMTTMDAVDRGRTRSVADQLKIQHGLANGTVISAVCSSLGAICFGQRTRRLSVGETLEIYRAFETPINWVILHRSREHGLKQAGVLAAFAFALATETDMEGDIGFLLDQLLSGVGIASDSPLLLLRKFLTSDEAKLLSRTTDRGIAELVLLAIHLTLKGVTVAKLELNQNGVEHFRALQPERVANVAALFKVVAISKVSQAA